ncbi:hypothetical protein ACFPRL_24215 [Pseudoclavibacter helvolus]
MGRLDSSRHGIVGWIRRAALAEACSAHGTTIALDRSITGRSACRRRCEACFSRGQHPARHHFAR